MSDAGPDRNGDATEIADKTLDRVFDTLAGRRRRYVIKELRSKSNNVATVAELADAITSQDSVTNDTARMIAQLHHQTLPRLDNNNIINYNRNAKKVHYSGDDLAETILDNIERVCEGSYD